MTIARYSSIGHDKFEALLKAAELWGEPIPVTTAEFFGVDARLVRRWNSGGKLVPGRIVLALQAMLYLKLTRDQALTRDLLVCLAADELGESSPAGQCAWCKGTDQSVAPLLPFGADGHAWLHGGECWSQWYAERKEQARMVLGIRRRPS